MDKLNCVEIKQKFYDYFKKTHNFKKGSSVIPDNDNSLLFVSAGMNQFKNIFLGLEESDIKTAFNTQNCIRAGGKHNDLEDVGKDIYHHTFFEMLGTWSFGDYWKEDAIKYIWEFLTDVLKLDKSRLYVTYYEGDENLKLPEDSESKNIWLKYIDQSRIIPFGSKDNFWEMANTGPCGPCTEIHYDKKGNRDASHLVNKDDPSVVEIWNIVFTQYNRKSEKEFEPLKVQHVDTGGGFERLTSIIQNKFSNYDTDIFEKIIKNIEIDCKREYWKAGNKRVNFRIVADHLRTLVIALNDNVEFGHKKRGNVLRRILRRTVYNLIFVLGGTSVSDLLVSTKDILLTQMHEIDPALFEKQLEIVKKEEHNYKNLLNKIRTIAIKNISKNKFNENKAFEFMTSNGAPPDMIYSIAQEYGVYLDRAKIESMMINFRSISRNN